MNCPLLWLSIFFQERKRGPGTYKVEVGSFAKHEVDRKSSGPGWARAYEMTQLAAMPHLLHKEQWQKKRMIVSAIVRTVSTSPSQRPIIPFSHLLFRLIFNITVHTPMTSSPWDLESMQLHEQSWSNTSHQVLKHIRHKLACFHPSVACACIIIYAVI